MSLNWDQFEKWTNAFGPSGFEMAEVGALIHDYVKGFSDEVTNDRTGSIIFRKGNTGPKIMLPGHMDEVGFIITGISKEGYLTFSQIGGWFDQSLLTQRILIRTMVGDKIPGIFAAKPPHIITADERKKVVTKDKMFIDIGCKSKSEVEALGINLGDPAVPDTKFEYWNRKQIDRDGENENEKEVKLAVGKAFDDRIGVFIATEVVRKLKEEAIDHPNQVYGVATTQEEVGLRGARTAAQTILPDLALVLEVDIAGDVPGVEKTKAPAEMSKGVSILVADGSMFPNQRLKEFVIKVAKELGIDYQLSHVFAGGTDGGVIHTTGSGCPSIVIGVPTRHIHSHNGIFDTNDLKQAVDLVIELVRRLDSSTVESFTSY